MTLLPTHVADPALDLQIERVVPVPPALVWAAWTEPEHVVKWFTPAPWRTTHCAIDLRPGGEFSTTMVSPEGDEHANTGCVLEVVPGERLVWTGALSPGFRPQVAPAPFLFTAVISIAPDGAGTRYTATAIHGTSDAAGQHDEMGFGVGWGQAFDQLVAAIQDGAIA